MNIECWIIRPAWQKGDIRVGRGPTKGEGEWDSMREKYEKIHSRNPSLIPQTRKIIGLGKLQTIQLTYGTFLFALKYAQIFKMKRVACIHVTVCK